MPGGRLARKVSLPLLTFYGLGTILGAGIYVLIGEVALRADQLAPFSFIFAALIAAVTAYSFARLASMFPRSAGAAAYVHAAFNKRFISVLVGLTVVMVGTVSAATMTRGFAGYFNALFHIPELVVIVSIILIITVIAIWGISQSLMIASIITIIEILGLLFVIYAVIDVKELENFSFPVSKSIYSNSGIILYAAFISFYAYIGFEDIVNIAEETKNPTNVVPLAITLSLIFSTLLYVALSVVCTVFIPSSIFASSNSPLASIVEYKGYNPTVMAMISMIAIINGALVQLIMASRVLYGMAEQKIFLPVFKSVNRKTRTPIFATIAVAIILIILATSFDLITLAEFTSTITLLIFIVVQSSLIYVSYNENSKNKLDFALPIFGILLNFILLFFGYFQDY